jgi:hypothetical protein
MRANVDFTLEGNCARCGSSRIILEVNRRRAVLPTCQCKEEALQNMLNAIVRVLDRELYEPMYEEARQELKEFIKEFDEGE